MIELNCTVGILISNRENAKIATEAIARLKEGPGLSSNELEPLQKALVRVNDSISDSCDCLLGRD